MVPHAWLFVDFAVEFLAVVLVGTWVFLDAEARESESPAFWGVGSVVFVPIVLLYLGYRHQIGERTYPAPRRETLLGIAAIGAMMALLVAEVTAPHGPFAKARYVLLWLPIGLVLGALVFAVRGASIGRSEAAG